MTFSFETFTGLHIYLVIADLLYSILDKILTSFSKNLLDPVLNVLIGKDLKKLQFKIGNEEEDVIKIGEILFEIIKMFFIALIIFYIYRYAKKYEKYNKLIQKK